MNIIRRCVFFDTFRNSWKVKFIHEGKRYEKYGFATVYDANVWYNEKQKEVFGDDARLNYVPLNYKTA